MFHLKSQNLNYSSLLIVLDHNPEGITSTPYNPRHPINTTLANSGISFCYMYPATNIPKQTNAPNKAIILLELIPPLFFKNIVRQSNFCNYFNSELQYLLSIIF
jgi:hypothetical protein